MRTTRTEGRAGTRKLPKLLDDAYLLLTSGRHTTASLAKALGISVATSFRVIKDLRRRGMKIESLKRAREWYYEVSEDEAIAAAWKADPLLRLVGSLRRGRRKPGQSEDDILYGRH